MKGDVKIASKTNPPSSFPINWNTLDMAEEEDKHGKQEEYPPVLWVFVPLRKQTEQMQCKLRKNCNSAHHVLLASPQRIHSAASLRNVPLEVATADPHTQLWTANQSVEKWNLNKEVNSVKTIPCSGKKNTSAFCWLYLPFPPQCAEMHTFTVRQKRVGAEATAWVCAKQWCNCSAAEEGRPVWGHLPGYRAVPTTW